MFNAGECIKLRLEALDENRVPRQVEEDVGQCRRHTVAACNDNQLGVTVQVPAVPLSLGALVVCGENSGEDVGLLGLLLQMGSAMCLGLMVRWGGTYKLS